MYEGDIHRMVQIIYKHKIEKWSGKRFEYFILQEAKLC